MRTARLLRRSAGLALLLTAGAAGAGTVVVDESGAGTHDLRIPYGTSSVFVEAWGAQGGTNARGVGGGLGAYASGHLAVVQNQRLTLTIGGRGSVSAGGFNGGGTSGFTSRSNNRGGGGGGATDVRLQSTGITARVLVAGGGGGEGGASFPSSGSRHGGSGGGGGGGYYGGGGGAGGNEGFQAVSTGGTQTAGGRAGRAGGSSLSNGTAGALGTGGNGGQNTNVGSISGGNGGAGGVGGNTTGDFGRATSSASGAGGGGAGGSSYVGGVTDGTMQRGVQSGDGRARVTYNTAEIRLVQRADFGTVTNDGTAELLRALTFRSFGGAGTYVDLLSFGFTGPDGRFDVIGFSPRRLVDFELAQFGMRFDARGLAAGRYSSTAILATRLGNFAYSFVADVVDVPAPPFAPIGALLLGLLVAGRPASSARAV